MRKMSYSGKLAAMITFVVMGATFLLLLAYSGALIR
jgi:hypothetical protein